MNRDHFDQAEWLLSIADADTNTLLRAIGHALLANTPPVLQYDAFNPTKENE